MSDCLFCKIVAGEIPSSKVYEAGSRPPSTQNMCRSAAAEWMIVMYQDMMDTIGFVSKTDPLFFSSFRSCHFCQL